MNDLLHKRLGLKAIMILFLLAFAFDANAQQLKVSEDFHADPTDLTAKMKPKDDLNGDPCGLVKLGLAFPNAKFEGDIISSEYMDGEWWIYMIKGSRFLTIKTGQLVPLRCEFPEGIRSNVTYTMTVIPDDAPTHQYLAFKISPPNATLAVNDEYWEVNADGSAQKYVNFGNYSYRVEAPNYHTEQGTAIVSDPNNTKIVAITLSPDFGWIEVAGTGSTEGASVYIDNAFIGHAPCKSAPLKSGQHAVRISKSLFATYTETVTVAENETTRLAPTLAPASANITLTVDADADIYVNDQRKGHRTWTGVLANGIYKVECKQPDHHPSLLTQEISTDMDGQTISLPAPTPICGSLRIESEPGFCKVIIDGKEQGITPKSINEIPIGQHRIRLEKEGFAPITKHIVIEEGKTYEMVEKLKPNPTLEEAITSPQKPQKEKKPKKEKTEPALPSANTWFATLNFAYDPSPQTSFGFTVGSVKKLGWFASVMSNFDFKATQSDLTADADGYVNDEYPDYSGQSCTTRLSVMGGMLLRVADPLCLRAGVGYGMRTKSWYTKEGDLVKMSNDSWAGLDASIGAQIHLKGFVISLDAVTTNFKTIEAKIGLGYSW